MDSRERLDLWVHIRQPYLIYGRRPPMMKELQEAPDETREEVKNLYAKADSGYCPDSCWLKRIEGSLPEVVKLVMQSDNAEGMASMVEILRLTERK